MSFKSAGMSMVQPRVPESADLWMVLWLNTAFGILGSLDFCGCLGIAPISCSSTHTPGGIFFWLPSGGASHVSA